MHETGLVLRHSRAVRDTHFLVGDHDAPQPALLIMFDRITLTRESVHSHSTVHEHRAPTDESIRLYKEMEDKALRNILQSVRIMNTGVDCVIHHINDPMGVDAKFIVQYKIKDVRIRLDVSIELFNCVTVSDKMQKVAQGLVEELSRSIAVQMLGGVSNDLARLPWEHL